MVPSRSPFVRLLAIVAAATLAVVATPPVLAADQLWFDSSEDWFSNVAVGATATGPMKIGSYPGAQTITSVVLDDPSGYMSIDADHCVGLTIGSHGYCSVRQTFRPLAAGEYFYTISATTADGLTGSVTYRAIARDPFVRLSVWDDLEWGVVAVGRTNTQWLYINNEGNLPADVTLSITGPDAAAFTVPDRVQVPAWTYVPGQVWMPVSFLPPRAGELNATLVYTYGGDTRTTVLHGTGYDIGNDDQATAIEVTPPYPFEDLRNLAFATTSEAEQSACGSLANGVWYRFTATEDTVLFYQFGPWETSFPIVAAVDGDCRGAAPNPLRVESGRTVYFTVGAASGTGDPGTSWAWFDAQPLRHISLTLNGKGTVDKAGTAWLSGTVGSDLGWQVVLYASVRQRSGHGWLTSEALIPVNMDKPEMPWSMALTPAAGKFVGGPIDVSMEAYDGEWEALGTHEYLGPTTVKLSTVAKP